MDDLLSIARRTDIGVAAILELLREETNGCPACMLAAVRQSGRVQDEFREDGIGSEGYPKVALVREGIPFDYRRESAEFWQAENERGRDRDEYGYGQ